MRRWWVVGVVTAALGAAGCDDGGPATPMEELEAAQALWTSTRPARYSYAVERRCFCLLEGPVRVTVDGLTVLTRVFVESGSEVPEDQTTWYPDVDGLFATLREAYAQDAHQVDVTYDPATGVPTELWIDYREEMADEELGFAVTEAVRGVS